MHRLRIIIFAGIFTAFITCKNPNKNLVVEDVLLEQLLDSYEIKYPLDTVLIKIDSLYYNGILKLSDSVQYHIYKLDKLLKSTKNDSTIIYHLNELNNIKISHPKLLNRCQLYSIGDGYVHISDYVTGATYYALASSRDESDKCSDTRFTYISAQLLYKSNNYRHALKLFKDTYDSTIKSVYDDFETRYFIQEQLSNIGLCYKNLKKYDSSLIFYKQCLDYIESQDDTTKGNNWLIAKGNLFQNTGDVYYQHRKHDSANFYYNKSLLTLSRIPKFQNEKDLTLLKKALNFSTGKSFDSAIHCINQIINPLRTIQTRHLYSEILYYLYTHQGNYKYAIKQLEIHHNITDSIFKESLAIKNANIRLLTEVKISQIRSDLQSKNDIQKSKNLYLLKILSSILSVSLLALIYYIIKLKKSISYRNELIAQINRATEKIHQSNNILAQQLHIKEKLLKSIAHDILNPISATYANVELIKLQTKDKQVTDNASKILDSLNKVISISKKLIERRGDKPNTPILLPSLINSCIQEIEPLAKSKQIKIIHKNTNCLNTHIDIPTTDVCRAIMNVINNSVKYSNRGSEIIITCRQTSNEIHLEIADSGIGIPVDLRKYLFTESERIQRSGTEGEQSNGIGLAASKNMLSSIGGDIIFRENNPAGSVFTIIFPMK